MSNIAIRSIARQIRDLNVAKYGYTAFYVDDTNGSDSYTGESWDQAFKTIQHAVDTADSWCKIFIKAATYAENVTIAKQAIQLIGEKKETVIISPASGDAVAISSNNCALSGCEMLVSENNKKGVNVTGDYNTIKDCIVGAGAAVTSVHGCYMFGDYNIVDDVVCNFYTGTTGTAITLYGGHNEAKNCLVDDTTSWTNGISIAGGDYNLAHDNTVKGCGTHGINMYIGIHYANVYHNNLISNSAQLYDSSDGNTSTFENFFDDHTTDTNNDGLCDTPYSFTGGTDYQPVSHLDGWKHISLGYESGSGSEYSGDIAIWESFEYPTDALLQAEWIEGGNAGNPTRSATAYYGQYGMQTVVTAGAVGNVYRLIAARNMKTLAGVSIAARSNKVGGDTFRFTLYDSSGNYNYWTQTIAAQDTWQVFNINPHSARSGGSATLVDIEDIVKIEVANLTASSTYIFDMIMFDSMLSSKIGVGYDGLDDAVEETSSVRGHLLLTNDTINSILANQAGEETISSYNLPNDVAENTAIEVTTTKRLRLDSIWLDFVNLVQNVTIKVYHKIDGSTYRQYDEFSWATTEEDGVLLRDVTINGDWKLTITSTVAQGAIKAIPYNVIKTTMEA